MIKKIITVKTANGNYRDMSREFNNEKHFENWYAKYSRMGGKIIGVEDVDPITSQSRLEEITRTNM